MPHAIHETSLRRLAVRRKPAQAARGVLQAKLGRQLSLRRTPMLTFTYDDSVERGVRMTKLIEDLAADLPEEERDAEQ